MGRQSRLQTKIGKDKDPIMTPTVYRLGFALLIFAVLAAGGCSKPKTHHVWDIVEIELQADHSYENPYKDVDVWVWLKGPGFVKKVWGFWDGGRIFKVRMATTAPGEWTWESGASVRDASMENRSGSFKAIAWTPDEIRENPNRRGFLRTNPAGPHGYAYTDGTPFFLLADTWWAAFTWRYPLEGKAIPADYVPDASNWCFEGGIMWLKAHGFNSIAAIASFPNGKRIKDMPTLLP